MVSDLLIPNTRNLLRKLDFDPRSLPQTVRMINCNAQTSMLFQITPVRLEERISFSTAYKMSFIQCVLVYTFGCKTDITIILQYSTLLKSSVMQ
jgi:hypothetical protein